MILSASLLATHARARSKTLMTLSAPPVAKSVLVGSNATDRTQPRCDERTVESFHGACHLGVGMLVDDPFLSCLLQEDAECFFCYFCQQRCI